MSNKYDEAVVRPPLDPESLRLEIDEVFTFNAPLTLEQELACQDIQAACQKLAQAIADKVPESREQTIAINSLLAAALWARHGITRRQVTVIAIPAAPGEDLEKPVPGQPLLPSQPELPIQTDPPPALPPVTPDPPVPPAAPDSDAPLAAGTWIST